jgi:antitoxin component of MazEF toxin-antitoxin module
VTQIKVGKWGKSLALRVPLEIARGVGLSDGESVEIEVVEGDIVVRRSAARDLAVADAQAAMAEITRAAKGRSLGGISIKELLNEGRRG